MKRTFLPMAAAFVASLLLASLQAAPAAPAPTSPPPQIVRLNATWFSSNGPPEAYRFGIYATGVDRNAVIVFDRDTLVPIETGATIDSGDDNIALPADQRFLRVTVPAKFRTQAGKVSVQVSQDGKLSAPFFIHLETAFAVP
jgi:hypothetical protein